MCGRQELRLQPLLEGETGKSQPIEIRLPTFPCDMFGVEVTRHNGGGWRAWQENAVNFCFGQGCIRAIVASYYPEGGLEITYADVDVGAGDWVLVMADGEADQNGRISATTIRLIVPVSTRWVSAQFTSLGTKFGFLALSQALKG